MHIVIRQEAIYVRAANILFIQIEHSDVRIVFEYHTGNDLVANYKRFARAVLFHVFPHFNDFACALMTENQWNQTERVTFKLMCIRTADAAPFHLDQNIVVSQFRDGIFLDVIVFKRCEHCNTARLWDAARCRRTCRARCGSARHTLQHFFYNLFYLFRINIHFLAPLRTKMTGSHHRKNLFLLRQPCSFSFHVAVASHPDKSGNRQSAAGRKQGMALLCFKQ